MLPGASSPSNFLKIFEHQGGFFINTLILGEFVNKFWSLFMDMYMLCVALAP